MISQSIVNKYVHGYSNVCCVSWRDSVQIFKTFGWIKTELFIFLHQIYCYFRGVKHNILVHIFKISKYIGRNIMFKEWISHRINLNNQIEQMSRFFLPSETWLYPVYGVKNRCCMSHISVNICVFLISLKKSTKIKKYYAKMFILSSYWSC